MIEQYDLRKKVEIYFISLIILISISYGIFRIYPLMVGPSIVINNLKDGDIVSSPLFQIEGKTKRSVEIKLQGKPIKIDLEGNFKETLVAYSPYTILTIVATDKYGASITKTLRVIPKENN